MSQNFYISDLHFGHSNVIAFDNRPFFNAQEMEESIITLWNETVSKKDTTYILGDFCWNKEPEWIRILNKLNGQKVLIKGNHDLKNMSAQLKSKFTDIKDYKEITDNGKRIVMSHYPIMCYKGSYHESTWMFHGHTHTTKEQEWVEEWTRSLITEKETLSHTHPALNRGQIINVGCMMPYVNYIPRTADELIEAWNQLYKKSR